MLTTVNSSLQILRFSKVFAVDAAMQLIRILMFCMGSTMHAFIYLSVWFMKSEMEKNMSFEGDHFNKAAFNKRGEYM